MTTDEKPEEWRKIILTHSRMRSTTKYSVSSYGRVRNDQTGRILKTRKDSARNGIFLSVCLSHYSIKLPRRVHRLVALAFLPVPDDPAKNEVNHLDADRTNCRLDNLEWCTRLENEQHKRFIEGMNDVDDQIRNAQ